MLGQLWCVDPPDGLGAGEGDAAHPVDAAAKLLGCVRRHQTHTSANFIEAEDVLWVGAGFRACLATESPLWVDCSVKRVEPGRGMGVTVELREDQSHRHYQELLAKLAVGN